MWSEANFIGGHRILDFLNTVSDRGKSRAASTLMLPTDLASWIEASDLCTKNSVDLTPSQVSLDAIIEFREAAYRVLVATLGNTSPPNADIQTVEHCLKTAIQRASLDIVSSSTIWRANQKSDHRHQDFFALLLHDFLRSPDMERLSQCERCTWLFLNSGRGRGRRWCNMATCGNRHKVEMHRSRNHHQRDEVQ
jgi:predicted RNA-binding Zn ribbon-like protein